jgi:hypothetical protein
MDMFAHKRCGEKHGKQFARKAVEYVLCNVVASLLSRAEAVESTPNLWAGAPASTATPSRPYVAVVS